VKVGAEGHVIAYNAVDGGKVRFAVYDPKDGKTFTKNVLIEIPVQASDKFTADATAQVSGMVASSDDAAATSNKIDGFPFNIKVNFLGDVDENNKVEVTDILLTADYILNNFVAPANFKNKGAADVESNDAINVTDILGIADIILSGTANGAKAAMMEESEPNFVDTLEAQ